LLLSAIFFAINFCQTRVTRIPPAAPPITGSTRARGQAEDDDDDDDDDDMLLGRNDVNYENSILPPPSTIIVVKIENVMKTKNHSTGSDIRILRFSI
jgi:hypothetical protein